MLIPFNETDFDDRDYGQISQKLLTGNNEKISRLCNNIVVQSYAFSSDFCGKLIFYSRDNIAKVRFEAGMVYAYGPAFGELEIFPMQMLRVFSSDKNDCFDLVEKYYLDLVIEQAFHCQD